MNHVEPRRFEEQSLHLDNFADIAKKIQIKSTELNQLSNLENCPYRITVSLDNADDLVMVVEQDYQLSKVLRGKYNILSAETALLQVVLRLTSIYQSGIHINTVEAIEYRSRILKHLHQI